MWALGGDGGSLGSKALKMAKSLRSKLIPSSWAGDCGVVFEFCVNASRSRWFVVSETTSGAPDCCSIGRGDLCPASMPRLPVFICWI